MSAQRSRAIAVLVIVAVAPMLAQPLYAADALPSHAGQLLATYCVQCHEGDEPEGNVHIQLQPIDWQQAKSTAFLSRSSIDLRKSGIASLNCDAR